MSETNKSKEMIRDIAKAKYLIRIYGFHLDQFGTGTKHNPIKLKSK